MKASKNCYCCDECGSEMYGDEKLYAYEWQYLCKDCFCEKTLQRKTYISFPCTEDTTTALAKALFTDVWNVNEVLEDGGGF